MCACVYLTTTTTIVIITVIVFYAKLIITIHGHAGETTVPRCSGLLVQMKFV